MAKATDYRRRQDQGQVQAASRQGRRRRRQGGRQADDSATSGYIRRSRRGRWLGYVPGRGNHDHGASPCPRTARAGWGWHRLTERLGRHDRRRRGRPARRARARCRRRNRRVDGCARARAARASSRSNCTRRAPSSSVAGSGDRCASCAPTPPTSACRAGPSEWWPIRRSPSRPPCCDGCSHPGRDSSRPTSCCSAARRGGGLTGAAPGARRWQRDYDVAPRPAHPAPRVRAAATRRRDPPRRSAAVEPSRRHRV